MPGDAGLQFPHDRQAVGGERSVLAAWNRGRETGPEIAVAVPAGHGLVENTAAVLVLGAGGEVWVEERRALPPQHLQEAAAAALGRLVGRGALGHRHARIGQNLRRHRRGQAERLTRFRSWR